MKEGGNMAKSNFFNLSRTFANSKISTKGGYVF